MVRRFTEEELQAETVVWPGLRSHRNAAGAPVIQPAQRQAMGLAAARADGRAPDSAEQERRNAEHERLRQLETAEAHRRGVEDGLRRAREEAAGEVKKAFEQVARTLEELAQVKRRLRREAEQDLVKLSLAVARRILYRELSTDPASIEGIVHAALQKLQQRETARVRAHPALAGGVRAALERGGQRQNLEVVADPGLAPGGILFETSFGDLDASIDAQLQEIQRGFADRLAIQ